VPHVANQEPPRTARRRSRPRPRADRGATSLAYPPPKGGLALAYLGVDELRPYDGNPRTHSSTQVAELARSIERFGFAAPVLAERDGTVIAGHGRLEAAKLLGMQRVPVVRLHHLTPEQARALRLADNRLAELSEWDEELLARELGELADLKIDLDGLGWDDDRLRELLGLELEPEPPAPEQEEGPRVLITKPGDLWSLGVHRLLCGDSTNREHLARLMEGELATLLATDPLYLVDYQEEGWDSFGDDEQGGAFFTAWLKVALEHCTERVPVYQWHASRRQVLVEQGWRANGLLLHQTTSCGSTSLASTGGVRAACPSATGARPWAKRPSGRSTRPGSSTGSTRRRSRRRCSSARCAGTREPARWCSSRSQVPARSSSRPSSPSAAAARSSSAPSTATRPCAGGGGSRTSSPPATA
jgi:ParB-like chromosome segregation protein Spo0J